MYTVRRGVSGRSTFLLHENATPRLSRIRWTTRRSRSAMVRRTKAVDGAFDESTITLAPTTERAPPDRRPALALSERTAAAAETVLAKPGVPQVTDLARREEAGELSHDAVEQRAPAAPQPADVQDLDLGLGLRARARAGGHRDGQAHSRVP